MTVKTYRKLPVEIQALYWDGTDSDKMLEEIEDFLQTGPVTDDYAPMFSTKRDVNYSITLLLDTLEGIVGSYKPCYILRGVQGEFYICEESIFHATYEEVNE